MSRRSAIRCQEGVFRTKDGFDLSYRGWSGAGPPRAAIAIVHGYGEHGGRYELFARYFAPLGYAVYACDLRGHGRSAGKRGHIDRFSDYLLDTDSFYACVRAMEPSCRVFLLGHSMGGLIAARFAEETALNLPGIVLSSPFLRIKMPVKPWKLAAASALSLLAPSIAIPSDLPLEWLSHDPQIVEHLRNDTLNHGAATPRWFTEILRAQREVQERAGAIRAPVALLYAGDDKITEAAECERLFERIPLPKMLRCYEGYYHEIFNEIGRERVYEDLDAWLKGQLSIV